LADAAEACWQAMLGRDLPGFGQSLRAGFEAQIAMFPNMIVPSITRLIDRYQDAALGWKVSGAGGGGYLILVAEQPIPNALRILIRRRDEH
jgi:galactokinase/mevalonate kinase-like predicted kinase